MSFTCFRTRTLQKLQTERHWTISTIKWTAGEHNQNHNTEDKWDFNQTERIVKVNTDSINTIIEALNSILTCKKNEQSQIMMKKLSRTVTAGGDAAAARTSSENVNSRVMEIWTTIVPDSEHSSLTTRESRGGQAGEQTSQGQGRRARASGGRAEVLPETAGPGHSSYYLSTAVKHRLSK